MRKEGYYWVKYEGKWQVALWGDIFDFKQNSWFLPGIEADVMPYEKDFEVMDERRILNPDERPIGAPAHPLYYRQIPDNETK